MKHLHDLNKILGKPLAKTGIKELHSQVKDLVESHAESNIPIAKTAIKNEMLGKKKEHQLIVTDTLGHIDQIASHSDRLDHLDRLNEQITRLHKGEKNAIKKIIKIKESAQQKSAENTDHEQIGSGM